MPASSRAWSSMRPAGPTNGRPARSSPSPGCSPTSITSERAAPSPKTVWVASRYRSQAMHPAAAAPRAPRSGRPGIRSRAALGGRWRAGMAGTSLPLRPAGQTAGRPEGQSRVPGRSPAPAPGVESPTTRPSRPEVISSRASSRTGNNATTASISSDIERATSSSVRRRQSARNIGGPVARLKGCYPIGTGARPAGGRAGLRYRRAMPGFDLHTHSTFSDGTLDPEQVVELAATRGLTGIALTDHDNTGGVERARAAAERTGLTVLLGCELSAEHDADPVHVLAYGFDPAEPVFAAKRAWIFEGRVGRTRRMVER